MIKVLKTFLSSLVQNAFIAVIIAIVTVPVLVSFFTGTLDRLIHYLSFNTPVWMMLLFTIASIIYTHYSRRKESESIEPESERFLIEDSGFKWRVIDHKNGYSSVDQIPLCIVHESEYVLTPGGQYICRESIESGCESKIMEPLDLTFYWNLAKSKANSIINKYETKH